MIQICYRCHEYHDGKADICAFCKIDSLIDAEIPEELEEDCALAVSESDNG